MQFSSIHRSRIVVPPVSASLPNENPLTTSSIVRDPLVMAFAIGQSPDPGTEKPKSFGKRIDPRISPDSPKEVGILAGIQLVCAAGGLNLALRWFQEPLGYLGLGLLASCLADFSRHIQTIFALRKTPATEAEMEFNIQQHGYFSRQTKQFSEGALYLGYSATAISAALTDSSMQLFIPILIFFAYKTGKYYLKSLKDLFNESKQVKI